MKQKMVSLAIMVVAVVGLLLVSNPNEVSSAQVSAFNNADNPVPGEHEMAVCTTEKNKAGKYTPEGCMKTFKKVPKNVIERKCFSGQIVKYGSCVVNGGKNKACTTEAKEKGNWCTCSYECVIPEKKPKK